MEQIFSDFSGGMNALAGVDKLDPKECLLAENVRLDETGNVISAGAFTHQNSIAYASAGGTSTNNAHSLYWNPSLGAVTGIGQDVFFGKTLGGQASGLAGSNTSQQKMSFASAPNRVYFDVGSTGYWSDMTNLLTVDWPPPNTAGATVTGPTLVGTGTATGSGVAWGNTGNINSTDTTLSTTAVVNLTTGTLVSNNLRATMTTNSFAVSTVAVTGIAASFVAGNASSTSTGTVVISLLKGGIPVGTPKSILVAGNAITTYTAGNSSDLWGLSAGGWAQGDINASTFGFQIYYVGNSAPLTFRINNGRMTVYQGAGFGAAAGASGALTGTYTWKVTFVAANGEESDGSNDSGSVPLSAQQGTLTSLPTGDARTTARNIYRKGNTLTSHYLVGTINDNVSTTFSDNQTDAAALTAGVILAGDVPGDYPNTRIGSLNVRFPVLHYDRIFWIVPGTNKLVWSKPLNGFAYPSINFLNVGDSKPCSRIVSIFGELIIIKTDSIWRLTGTDESSFDLSQTPSAVGTDQPFTVVANPDKIIFANRWGLWVFNGYTSQPLTPKLDLWFKQDDRTNEELFGVNGFHPPEVASTTVPLNFEAVGNSDKYVWAYAEAGQAANNSILVFDLKHANITKRKASVQPLSLAIDPVTGFVYMGDNSGFVSLLDDWAGPTGGGNPVNFDFQTGYIDLQRGSNKALWALEFFVDTDGQNLTPSVYYDNGVGNETLAAISTTSLQRVVRTCEAGNARKMQNFSVRLNGSINPVNVSGQPQIQLVHIKALFDLRTGRARTGQ
jgi:hypothetical protein